MSPERMAAQVAGWEWEVASAVAAGLGGVLGVRVLLVRAYRFAGRAGESVAVARAYLAACENAGGADDPPPPTASTSRPGGNHEPHVADQAVPMM
ncbi:MAG: hypothetical protein ACYCO9_03825 [Streptosporangiaceae bacterium]